MGTSLAVSNTAIQPTGAFTADLYGRFVSYIDASQKTIQTYTWSLRQFFSFLQAEGIRQPTRDDILSYKAFLANEGKKPTTQQNYLAAVRQLFKWTEREGIYPNIADNVKGIKVNTKRHKRDYLTKRQVNSLLQSLADGKTIQEVRDYAMIRLMVTCGLRTIEVSRANVEDLRPRGDHTVLYVLGKGRHERSDFVKVPPKAEEAIRKYIAMRGKLSGADPLFASTSNKNLNGRMTTRAISGIVKARMKAVGLDNPQVTAHSLRHSAVTIPLQAGIDIREVRQYARHGDVSTTIIYDHSLKEECNRCAETIEDVLI